jgi:hypothetical protein
MTDVVVVVVGVLVVVTPDVVVTGDVVLVVTGAVEVVDAVVGADVVVGADAVVVVVADGAVLVVVVVDDVADDADVVVVVPTTAAAQAGTVMTLSSRVTAPFRAKTRPLTSAPVLSVMDVSASNEPLNWLVVPSVAELPTCQKTWHACAPFSSTTRLPVAATNVEPA